MKRLKLYILTMLVALISSISACTDDLLYDPDEIGEGYVDLSATVQFEPQASALESRATDGKAMSDINSLTVILYNANDTTTPLVYNLKPNQDFEVRPDGGLPHDYEGTPAESTTAKASFTLPQIEVGHYYMYAIANMGVLSPEEVGTPHQLKHINLTWNKGNVASNNQMFGYFTPVGSDDDCQGFDANKLTVSRKYTQFHAWLKRAASKVTIVYDGSKMHNDILVYIHKVTIHDIPKNCYLGADNTPVDSATQLIKQGESIYYNAAGKQLSEDFAPDYSKYESWMRIGRGSEKKGAVSIDEAGNTILHPEDATALYFYENLQGNYKEKNDQAYYKGQIWEELGQIINKPGQPDYKDNVPCGTYIEVDAFYVSNHAPFISSGPIKYRFMLGQDTEWDYNAFRNRHYKLTLKFKGYANQADWHIEYIEEKPEIYVPAKYYVSYLYNDKSLIPVRVTGECTNFECEIIENNWAPYDSTGVAFAEVPDEGELGQDTGESFQWNRQVWENAGKYETTGDGYTYGRHVVRYDDKEVKGDTTMYITPIWAGFLSLTVPSAYEDEKSTKLPVTLFNGSGHFYSNKSSMDALRDYFYAKGGSGNETNDIPQNKRTYELTANEVGKTTKHGNGRNAYFVTKQLDGTTTLQMPLWTRPQSMIRISGFTGNNPFEPYMRKAVIRFRATFKLSGNRTVTRIKDVPVFQVRRIVNPKGVWRSHDDKSSFHVLLTQRRNAGSKTFDSFRSEGSWKAYVEKSNGGKFCSVSGGVETKNDTIFGDTDSPVEFDINFAGTVGANESKCAIVVVDYHGFSCRHTILVRQGVNQPLELVSGGGKWSAFSLYAAQHDYSVTTGSAKAVLTKNPLAMGTFFKRGNLNDGILVKNNETYGNFEKITGALYLADINPETQKNKTKKWSEIDGLDYCKDATNKNFYANNDIHTTYSWPVLEETVGSVTREYTVPTIEQYEAILNNCECGFGVFYYDGATTTGRNITTAYQYKDHENTGVESECGMRGAVIYNSTNVNQVFFPLGPKGVGRRTLQGIKDGFEGELRYGSVSNRLTAPTTEYNNQYRPICYNLPAAAGAIYWARVIRSKDLVGSWDINYGDLNFNSYDYATSFYKGGDALPIKLIQTK